jgi:hypothetical protein
MKTIYVGKTDPWSMRKSKTSTWIQNKSATFTCLLQAFVLAFTSDFVVRQIYIYQHGGSLDGYINSTLSSKTIFNDHSRFTNSKQPVYDMRDHNAEITPEARINRINNSSLCYYKGLRFPPDHPKKYQLTPSFWYEMGMRLVCVIVFEVDNIKIYRHQ